MIVEFGYGVVAHVIGWLFTFMPPMDALDGVAADMSTVFAPLESGLSGLGGWIPWGTVTICASVTMAMWLGTLVLRVIKSFLPTISG